MDNIVINVTESVEDVTIEVAEISEWLAETVSQEEAEAGTATDRRAWTAQRVKQAIDALGGGETLWEADGETTVKPKLDRTVNHDKITGLGDAATKNVGTGSGDVAAGNDSRFPTTDEKAALAGTGTPSSSNKFVTADDIPVKASDSEIDTGTDDAKFATAKAIADSDRGRKITYGTADPTGGSDGDIYLQYEA